MEKCKGDPQNPLSDEEIVEKFCRCVKGMLDQRKRDSMIEKIIHLEYEKDITNLVKLFC
jgi:2-methylcitrate dehydratase PrpD